MRSILRRTRASLLSLAVLGALGFGASAALAGPVRVPACQDPTADGPCSSDTGCRSYCDRLLGPGTAGFCTESTYCCYCTLA
jgi:hypothetical protein